MNVYRNAMPSIVVGNGNGTEVKRRVMSLEEENRQLRGTRPSKVEDG